MSLKENNRIVIATRSMSVELFSLSENLLKPLELRHLALTNTEADEYFYKLVDLDADWVINIDEDAFVTHPQRILDLLLYMKKEGYACCGMPDGGVFSHRFHNPVVQNAFFNIINIGQIKEEFSKEEAKSLVHIKEYEDYLPSALIRSEYKFDNFEPYYPFFFWFLKHKKKILYLDALEWNRDKTSTILLDHLGKPFLIHCWYSRVFLEQPERFIQTANFAKQIQEKVKTMTVS